MLSNLIEDLRSTTKPKEKLKILATIKADFLQAPFLQWAVKATYEPFVVYHVKLKKTDIPEAGETSIVNLKAQSDVREFINFCEHSNSSKKNKAKAISLLETFNKGSQDLIIGILHKNWKSGVSSKAFDELFPGLITKFEVQLSNKYREAVLKKKYKPIERLCSYKLDGVRGEFLRMTDIDPDLDWVCYSRQGKEFLTVDHLKVELEKLYQKNGKSWWDGEVYIEGADFEDVQGLVTSFTTGTKEELDFHAFIAGTVEDFFAQKTDSIVIVTDDLVKGTDKIVEAEQWLITEDQIEEELEKAFELGYEGIMLRDPNHLYDFKRSDALLKLKDNDTDASEEEYADCLVTKISTNDLPVIVDGKITYETLLNKIYVQQEDGIICKVGSGFDLEFRKYYTENPEELVGKVIEAMFQGYGKKGRMRFPRLKRVREDIEWSY